MIADRTRSFIGQLAEFQGWFENLGQPLRHDTVHQVNSLDEALTRYLSINWESTKLEAQNGLTILLDRDHLDRFDRWNDLVHEIEPLIEPVVDRITEDFLRDNREAPQLGETIPLLSEEEAETSPLRQLKFWSMLRVDLLFACLEEEHSDIVNLGFYSELSSWYAAGRLPCGLSGTYPNGKLFVY